MSQTLDNGMLKEQVDALRKEVAGIAENIAVLHNLERSIDQKTMVIGRALIEQKKATEQVTSHQNSIEVKSEEARAYADKKQTILMNSVHDVWEAIEGLRNLETREDVLLKSLDSLSKNQTAFMKSNMVFAKTAENDMEKIRGLMADIKSMVSNMDLTDQVRFMNEKANAIQAMLISYTENRTKIVTAMAAQTKSMETKINGMQAEMEKQQESVKSVIKVSRDCEERTRLMCEKLERLLSERKTATDIMGMSLEDMFAAETPKKPAAEDLIEDEISLEEIFTASEKTIDNTSEAEVANKYEQEYRGMEEEKPVEKEIEPEVVPVQEPETAPKKGFFGRLFGGK